MTAARPSTPASTRTWSSRSTPTSSSACSPPPLRDRDTGFVSLVLTEARVSRVLTRTSGFLRTVSSHSLQPYRGCTFGGTLCGVGCYVQHNRWVTRGAPWGGFLEVRTNAADAYREQYDAERAWARRSRDGFTIFLSSSTEPFLPQEDRFGVTRRVLEAMCERAPDGLIIQTHTDRVTRYLDLYPPLAAATSLRFHISIESDRDRLPGLPPPASSVAHEVMPGRVGVSVDGFAGRFRPAR